MKARIIPAVAILLLTLPGIAVADTVDFNFSGGSISGSSASGLTSTGSTLTLVDTTPPPGSPNFSGVLGSVSIATGALLTGSLAGGGTLAGGAGTSVVITANGTWGSIPSGNVVYSGVFIGPLSWTFTGTSGGSFNYTLSGVASGGFSPEFIAAVSFPGCTPCAGGIGFVVSFNVSSSTPFGDPGSGSVTGGNVDVTVVPEPGTLALFGTGLISVAGMLRRRRAA